MGQRPDSARCPNKVKDEIPDPAPPEAEPTDTFRHRTGRRRTGDSTPLRMRGHRLISFILCAIVQRCHLHVTSASCTPSPTQRAWPLSPRGSLEG